MLLHALKPIPEVYLPHALAEPGIPERRVLHLPGRSSCKRRIQHRIYKHLEDDPCLFLITGPDREYRGKASSGAVPSDRDPLAVYAESAGIIKDEHKRITGVPELGWKRRLIGCAVGYGDYHAPCLSIRPHVPVDIWSRLKHESSAMEIQEAWHWGIRIRTICDKLHQVTVRGLAGNPVQPHPIQRPWQRKPAQQAVADTDQRERDKPWRGQDYRQHPQPLGKRIPMNPVQGPGNSRCCQDDQDDATGQALQDISPAPRTNLSRYPQEKYRA